MNGQASDHLIKMANEILLNIGGGGDEEAVTKTAAHIEKFWTAVMRRQLVERGQSGGEQLPPLLADVIALIQPQNGAR